MQEINQIKIGFMQRSAFPDIVGLIDGTHIKIRNPGGPNSEVFRNRKGVFSINAQVVCDSNMKILDIVARWPGSTHDARIFNNSQLCRKLSEGNHNGYLLGDQGYPCKSFLMTPVNIAHTEAEHRYNNAHRNTRNAIERLFGIWKRRFPCLSQELRFKPEKACVIIVACAVLHNISLLLADIMPDNNILLFENEPPAQHANGDITGNAKRRLIIQEHFS